MYLFTIFLRFLVMFHAFSFLGKDCISFLLKILQNSFFNELNVFIYFISYSFYSLCYKIISIIFMWIYLLFFWVVTSYMNDGALFVFPRLLTFPLSSAFSATSMIFVSCFFHEVFSMVVFVSRFALLYRRGNPLLPSPRFWFYTFPCVVYDSFLLITCCGLLLCLLNLVFSCQAFC